MKRQKYPKNIESAEKAAKLTLRLWKELEKGIANGNFKQQRLKAVEDYYGCYDITVIKAMIIGHEFYKFNCPLCHVYDNSESSWNHECGNCPLEIFKKGYYTGCMEMGYDNWMNLSQVKRFRKNLEKALKDV